jgi:transcriptional regulator EpsA
MPAEHAAGAGMPAAGPAALEAHQVEALLLNLDAAVRVHSRAQFFKWTQGLLQSLVPHEVLVCALRGGEARALRAESFGTAPLTAAFGELFVRDAAAAPVLLGEWRERGYQPLACAARPGAALCGGEFARELERLGAGELIAHGACDAEGRAAVFFVFCCRPGATGALERYLVQLALPTLHAAWLRAQADGAAAGELRAGGAPTPLTPRELEILRWIAIGKSNFEVGAILHISPLTVKNHVQKILRKMNVVNRTQAVGKALETRIIAR